jgi:hypothetical protein
MVEQAYPERFKTLMEAAQAAVHERHARYEVMARKANP